MPNPEIRNKLNINGSPEIRSAIRIITPEEAEILLKCQGTNRNIRRSSVEQLARDMESGNWIIGDPIKLDNNGVLIDGQHRLSAVILTKKPQKFLVLTGYLPESKQVLDTGLSRTAANIGQILGKDITQRDESLVNVFYLPGSRSKLTTTERLVIYDIYRDGIKFADSCSKTNENHSMTSTTRVLIAKAYYYENHELLKNFCQVYQTGFAIDGDDDSSAIALGYYKQKISSHKREGTYDGRQSFYLAAQESLEKFIKRQAVKKILFKQRDTVDRYPIPHIHKNWEKYGKRYKAMIPELINTEIKSQIAKLQ